MKIRMKLYIILVLYFICVGANYDVSADEISEFSPHVTATCKTETGIMNIKVSFDGPFYGAIHSRDNRTANCMSLGDGSKTATLSINLFARNNQPDFCSVFYSNRTEERSVQLAVRIHKTLELADDKFYIITCGKNGFSRDDNSDVVLKFFENNRRVRETFYGREYTIRAEVVKSNNTNGIRVRNCFAFDNKNTRIPLNDQNGCPIDSHIISKFKNNLDGRSATATLSSMFKFPDSSEVHIQCEILSCATDCLNEDVCDEIAIAGFGGDPATKTKTITPTGNGATGATTVFVLDPDTAGYLGTCDEGSVRPGWLLWLTITLGVLFLIMLLMNIFLCTAMSCSCARTEIIEKEPSIIEEYDPYRSWHSQYGSRYSLHGRDGQNKGVGYASGGSTIRSDRY